MMNRTMHRPVITALLSSLLILGGCSKGEKAETLVVSAKEALAKRDYNTASIQLKNAAKKAPDNAEIRFLLGKVLLDSGNVVDGSTELKKAMDLGQAKEDVLPLLAKALVEQGQGQRLVAEYGNVKLAQADAQAELLSQIALGLLATNKPDQAQAKVNEALSTKADYPTALLIQARILASNQKLEEAEALVDKVLANAAARKDALILKANIQTARGNREGSLKTFQTILENSPTDLTANREIISQLIANSKFDEAAQALDKLGKSMNGHPTVQYLRGLLLSKQNKPAEARELLNQSLKSAPDNFQAVLLSGTVEQTLGANTVAEERYLKAVQLQPDHPAARRLLAALQMTNGSPDKALETIAPLKAQASKDPAIALLLGEILVRNGKAREALPHFETAIQLSPNNNSIKIKLAAARILAGETDKGRQELEALSKSDEGIVADEALSSYYLETQQADKALAAIARMEAKQPTNPLVYGMRGNALAQKKDFANATKSYLKALELRSDFFPAMANLTGMEAARGNNAEAIKYATDFVNRNPKHVDALLTLAFLHGRNNASSKDILAIIERAVAADPNSTKARVALATSQLKLGDKKQAVATAEKANADLPNRPAILEVLGMTQAEAGEHNQAIKSFTAMAELMDNSPRALMQLAFAQQSANDLPAAEQTLRKAFSKAPEEIGIRSSLIGLLVKQKKFDAALALAREIQGANKQAVFGLELEGDIMQANGKYAEAMTAFRKALALNNTSTLAIKLHLAATNVSANEAQKVADELLKQGSKDHAFRNYLAERAMATKDFAGAVQHYRVLLGIQPNNANLLNNMAWCLSQLKDPKAIEYAEQANKLVPHAAAYMDTLAVLLIEKGELARAIELLKEVVQRAPNALLPKLHLAQALAKKGDKPAAKAELEPLRKLGETFSEHAEVQRLYQTLQ